MLKPKNTKSRFISTVTIGEKGQIVIPKTAREMFDLEPGDTIVLLADKKRGIALVQNDKLMKIAESVFDETLPESEDDEKVEFRKAKKLERKLLRSKLRVINGDHFAYLSNVNTVCIELNHFFKEREKREYYL